VPEPGNPQAFNRYSYVLGNPLRFIDPTGHCAEDDEECWEVLWEMEATWEIDIKDEHLWELEYLESLLNVLRNAAEFVGGTHVLRDILASSAERANLKRFQFHGTLEDWGRSCTLGCKMDGQIGFNLKKIFGSNNTGLWHKDIGVFYRLQPSSGELTMAHELAHVMVREIPTYLPAYEKLYVNKRHAKAPLYDNDPAHHLVQITALFVAAGNTWGKVRSSDTLEKGRVPPIDQRYVEGSYNYWSTFGHNRR
jgi:hypothetical protein